MKKLLAVMLIFLFAAPACVAEAWPVYEVIGTPAFLWPTVKAQGLESAIYSVPAGSRVYAREVSDELYLVMTQEGYCGYMYKYSMKSTGKSGESPKPLNEESISKRSDIHVEYIEIAANAVLREDGGSYPQTIYKGEITHDVNAVLACFLGEGYTAEERNEWSNSTDYREKQSGQPWESKVVYVYDDGRIWYYDPMVSGERGGEYQPPHMNMLPEDSAVIAKGYLEKFFTDGELEHLGKARRIAERWSYSDRWMTEAEYKKYMYNQDLHYFVFEHVTEDGISILGDQLMATVGVNGLNGFDLKWHEFSESGERIAPMPLAEAVALANSTRFAKTHLLYADLVYSNWVSGTDEYNLSWYLVTDNGSYVVDCVLNAHKCDSYEY